MIILTGGGPGTTNLVDNGQRPISQRDLSPDLDLNFVNIMLSLWS